MNIREVTRLTLSNAALICKWDFVGYKSSPADSVCYIALFVWLTDFPAHMAHKTMRTKCNMRVNECSDSIAPSLSLYLEGKACLWEAVCRLSGWFWASVIHINEEEMPCSALFPRDGIRDMDIRIQYSFM